MTLWYTVFLGFFNFEKFRYSNIYFFKVLGLAQKNFSNDEVDQNLDPVVTKILKTEEYRLPKKNSFVVDRPIRFSFDNYLIHITVGQSKNVLQQLGWLLILL